MHGHVRPRHVTPFITSHPLLLERPRTRPAPKPPMVRGSIHCHFCPATVRQALRLPAGQTQQGPETDSGRAFTPSPFSPDLRQGALEALPLDVVGALQIQSLTRFPVEHQVVAAAVYLSRPVGYTKTRDQRWTGQEAATDGMACPGRTKRQSRHKRGKLRWVMNNKRGFDIHIIPTCLSIL